MYIGKNNFNITFSANLEMFWSEKGNKTLSQQCAIFNRDYEKLKALFPILYDVKMQKQ